MKLYIYLDLDIVDCQEWEFALMRDSQLLREVGDMNSSQSLITDVAEY